MTGPVVDAMGDPWGARARDWAEVEDEGSRPLFETVLDLLQVGTRSSYLDVGCGSGLACRIGADRGANVSGIDLSPGLIAIAAERTPDADLRVGDMGALPWADASFDAVSFINTFFFAADQEEALREAARVTAAGGRVAVTSWSVPEKVQSLAFLEAVGPLLPPMPVEVDPFIVPQRLRELAETAGLRTIDVVELDWTWDYHVDLETALRGLMSVGLSTIAIAAAGEASVREAITEALKPFRTTTGGYRLENTISCLLAEA